jgi:alanine dehydrogenase
MADHGVEEAIRINESLRKGVSCYKGCITHRHTANKKGFKFVDIFDILSHTPKAKARELYGLLT